MPRAATSPGRGATHDPYAEAFEGLDQPLPPPPQSALARAAGVVGGAFGAVAKPVVDLAMMPARGLGMMYTAAQEALSDTPPEQSRLKLRPGASLWERATGQGTTAPSAGEFAYEGLQLVPQAIAGTYDLSAPGMVAGNDPVTRAGFDKTTAGRIAAPAEALAHLGIDIGADPVAAGALGAGGPAIEAGRLTEAALAAGEFIPDAAMAARAAAAVRLGRAADIGGRAVAGAFIPGMVQGAAEGLHEFREGGREEGYTSARALRGLAGGVGSGVFAGMAGLHAGGLLPHGPLAEAARKLDEKAVAEAKAAEAESSSPQAQGGVVDIEARPVVDDVPGAILPDEEPPPVPTTPTPPAPTLPPGPPARELPTGAIMPDVDAPSWGNLAPEAPSQPLPELPARELPTGAIMPDENAGWFPEKQEMAPPADVVPPVVPQPVAVAPEAETPAPQSAHYAEAAKFAAEQGGRVSTSSLQRRFRIGYKEAAGLLDSLREEGAAEPAVDLPGPAAQKVVGQAVEPLQPPAEMPRYATSEVPPQPPAAKPVIDEKGAAVAARMAAKEAARAEMSRRVAERQKVIEAERPHLKGAFAERLAAAELRVGDQQAIDAQTRAQKAKEYELSPDHPAIAALVEASKPPLVDALTGVGTLRAYDERVLSLAHDHHVTFFDLSKFKAINDTHGHDVGDQVLQAFAEIVAEEAGKGNTYRRTGGVAGDEFFAVHGLGDDVMARVKSRLASKRVRVYRADGTAIDIDLQSHMGEGANLERADTAANASRAEEGRDGTERRVEAERRAEAERRGGERRAIQGLRGGETVDHSEPGTAEGAGGGRPDRQHTTEVAPTQPGTPTPGEPSSAKAATAPAKPPTVDAVDMPPAQLRARISTLLPGLPIVEKDGGYVLPTRSGKRVVITPRREIVFDKAALAEGHGKESVAAVEGGGSRIAGSTRTIGHDVMVDIVDAGKLPHEIGGHVFLDHFATETEKGVLRKEFEAKAKEQGRAWDEVMADDYNAWFDKPESVKGPVAQFFSRIKEFFSRIREVFNPTKEGIYKKIKSGEPFQRESAETGPVRQAFATAAQAVGDRVENFRKWFGQSKVVDSDGAPLEVFHGTSNMDADPSTGIHRFRAGSHFGTSEQANTRAGRWADVYGEGDSLYSAYLNIKNPKRVFDQPSREAWAAEMATAKAEGHDGLVYRNEAEGRGDSYVIFDPRQVKSATGNRGSFDPANPDIRYATGKGDGERAENLKKWYGKSEPLVGYHGSPHEFTEFASGKAGQNHDAGYYGAGHYFSDTGEMASGYAADMKAVGRTGGTGKYHLKMENPFHWDTRTPEGLERVREAARAAGVELREPRGMQPRLAASRGSAEPQAFSDYLRSQGYDGIIHTELGAVDYKSKQRGPDRTEYVAFEPTQIKSATGNSGAYGKTGDVRYATAPVEPPDVSGIKIKPIPEKPRAVEREKETVLGKEGRAAAIRAANAGGDELPVGKPGGDPDAAINWGRVNTADHIKAMQGRIVEAIAEPLKKARGHVSQEQTHIDALASGLTEKDIVRMARDGEGVTAMSNEAGRMMREDTARRTADLIDAAAELKRSGADEVKVLEAERAADAAAALHAAVTWGTVRQASETGRALAIYNKLSEGLTPSERFFKKALKEVPLMTEAQRNALAKAVVKGDHAEIAKVAREAFKPSVMDQFLEYWKAGLVSGPATIGGNFISNTLFETWRTAERAVSGTADAVFSAATGAERTRYAGEAFKALTSLRTSVPRAMSMFWDVLKDPRTDFDLGSEARVEHAIPKIPGKTGEVIRTPFRVLKAFDEAAKHVARQNELFAQAYRMAKLEGGKNVETRMAEIVKAAGEYGDASMARKAGAKLTAEQRAALADPRSAHLAKAMDHAALQATFQDQAGKITQGILLMRGTNPLWQFILPFVKTPSRLLAAGLERTPLGFAKVWKGVREGTLRDRGEIMDAVTKPMIGTLLGIGFVAAAKEGLLTGSGPADPKERRLKEATGWQPFSFKVGDQYISYKRLEPLSTTLGLAADFVEASAEDRGKIAEKIQQAVVDNITSKSYLQGVVNLGELLADPKRYGATFAKNLESSLVPNIVGKAAVALDPTVRDTTGVLGSLEVRIPGVSTLLPAKRAATGDEITRPGSALERFASPLTRSPEKDAPLERELLEIDYAPSAPTKSIALPGTGGKVKVELTPDEMKVMQDFDRQASERLRKILRSPGYRAMPVEARQKYVRRIYDQAGTAAKQRVISSAAFRSRARAQYAQSKATTA